jgi:hypothetical protein
MELAVSARLVSKSLPRAAKTANAIKAMTAAGWMEAFCVKSKYEYNQF